MYDSTRAPRFGGVMLEQIAIDPQIHEAMVNHARIAADFDWPRWRELRF